MRGWAGTSSKTICANEFKWSLTDLMVCVLKESTNNTGRGKEIIKFVRITTFMTMAVGRNGTRFHFLSN